MPTPKSPEVVLSSPQRDILERISRRATASYREVLRAQLILLASEGLPNTRISKQLNCSSDMVKQWRSRWLERVSELQEAEQNKTSSSTLEEVIGEIFQDKARSGAPSIYSAEDYCQIMVVAVEKPEDSGYPISHWTAKELTIECHKRGIAAGISQRQVGRFLKKKQI